MNEQIKFWEGSFGDSYTERNQVSAEERLPFWRDIIEQTKPGSVLEVGCNRGHNLAAIKQLDPGIRAVGIDVNVTALAEADDVADEVHAIAAQDIGLKFNPGEFDLVFTCGVLIHVPPEDLLLVMQNIKIAAYKYVLAVEYDDVDEIEVNYRGHKDRLWRRPYGRYYQQLGLTEIDGGAAPGFDQCEYYLLEKQI